MNVVQTNPYFFTSDLHIGDGSPRDDFTDRYAANLLSDLLEIKACGGQVFLLGDVLDIWRYGFDAIMSARRDLIASLCAAQPLYIVGNHEGKDFDRYTHALAGCTFAHRIILPTSIGNLYLAHGHEFDLFNGWFPTIGKAATAVASGMGKIWPAAEDCVSNFGNRLIGNGRHAASEAFTRTVVDWASGFAGVDGILLGHTHRIAHATLGLGSHALVGCGYYRNLGTFAQSGWLIIESSAGEVYRAPAGFGPLLALRARRDR